MALDHIDDNGTKTCLSTGLHNDSCRSSNLSAEPETEKASVELEEIIVTATRNRRSFGQQPTLVEVLNEEELNEKANMKPGDIRMLLNETTGIHIQQTSATSFNSSVRIQGLSGKYTQLLRDGMPMYGGLSSGLSLLQISHSIYSR